ncbi:DJ-1/PfpI family protein [Rhodanobacter sp. DHB23]|uniref:DJ-1/PfpI family protein n=1 Tax=Rhodanobacter sp. DHB23 TaxID=2775923 RepID=UPI001783A919|nr:DJ-1/PfpI family protein [Rhodanobacter sp. DHB23]MBD8872607.1 DJ-1/PfpI family protein [Rhodanobacter sp. DHB23]
MKHVLLAAVLATLPMLGHAEPKPANQRPIKVAFAISPRVNVMDVAGPWEVFADTSVKDAQGKDVSPYELYTVAANVAPLHSEGANRPGLTITPDYDFTHAPTPDIVVVPAQMGGAELQAWLRKIHAQHVTIMSVCTGAFQVAHAGLLKDKQATTHHWYFGDFAREFPDVKLIKQVRYVQADPATFTAGGLTSGIDLALHMVADHFGPDVAQQTADFMEYLGTGWKTDLGISPLAMPVTRQNWTGRIGGKDEIVLHRITYGASPTYTVDVPSMQIKDAPVTPSQHGEQAHLLIAIPQHPATIDGRVDAAHETLTGTFTQNGKSKPLTLEPVYPAP